MSPPASPRSDPPAPPAPAAADANGSVRRARSGSGTLRLGHVRRVRVRRHRPGRRLPGDEPGEVAERLRRVAVVGQPGPLDEVSGLQVLRHRRTAEEAGADRHRRREVGLDAGAAEAVADVHRDPQHVDGRPEVHDRARVAAVDRGRVAPAADPQHGPGRVDAPPRGRHPDQAEHRAQLLVRERLLGDHQVERGEQDPRGARAPGCPPRPRSTSASLPTNRMSKRPPGNSASRDLRPARRARAGSAPCPLELPQQRGGDRLLNDQHRLVGAQDGVVEALAVHDPLAALARSARGVHQHGHVAGPHPDRRVARAVGGAHDRYAPGGDDHAGALVGHQRVDQRHRRLVDHLDDAVGRARRDRRVGQRPGGVGAALPGQRVRAEMTTFRVISASSALKNTVATGLVDGVSASTTPGGPGQLDHLRGRVEPGGHVVVPRVRLDQPGAARDVLEHLVLGHAEPGLAHRPLGVLPRLGRARLCAAACTTRSTAALS